MLGKLQQREEKMSCSQVLCVLIKALVQERSNAVLVGLVNEASHAIRAWGELRLKRLKKRGKSG